MHQINQLPLRRVRNYSVKVAAALFWGFANNVDMQIFLLLVLFFEHGPQFGRPALQTINSKEELVINERKEKTEQKTGFE